MPPAVLLSTKSMVTEENKGHQERVQQYQKGVKYLCDGGIKTVPTKYILPALERPTAMNPGRRNGGDDSKVNIKLPIIDFAQLQAGPNRLQALQSLAYACENYGFFQLVNHGITEEVMSSMRDVARRFFELPMTEREKYMSSDMSTPVRYGTSFNQTKDGVFCWRDFLKLVCHPLSDLLPLCPSSPLDFRKRAIPYVKETKLLFAKVVEAILESLGVEEKKTGEQKGDDNEITKQLLEDGSQLMVVNYYPQCPNPELTLGIPPHSDYGFLTLLLQDDVPGLQIRYRGDWVTVEPIPGAFVINVGDHLEIFSNGRYKSVLHRVVVNSLKSRISIASLHSLPFETTVKPSPKLINESNPRRYKDTDFATFLEYINSCDAKEKNFLESRKLTS
ncbi:PREDICTED: protein DMR6-LIKE OXYGENASE 2-like [Ipomoea nil]|uniref:protein DMR6-LIKE OXYGENASE 2-like n=1 Tax=Ipomoea nil TaxID=35883 RepID=UPI000900E99F|nr:PREDICTED: protein DMR6-LIKE OXYGENASE 2-like [Ipomoea nil]